MYVEMTKGRGKPTMMPYVLQGVITVAVVIQLAVASLVPASPSGSPLKAPAGTREHGHDWVWPWQRQMLEFNSRSRLLHECETADCRSRVEAWSQCLSRYGGQHLLHQMCSLDALHSKGSFEKRSPDPRAFSSAAALYQAEAMSRGPRMRSLRQVRAPFRTMHMEGEAVIPNWEEVAVLMSVKDAIAEDPLGVLGSWHPNASTACSWAGVMCSPHEEGEHVVALDLSGRQLVGNIRLILVAIARLDFLQHLDLSVNGFVGSIWGPALANMSSLQYLNFTSNQVTGSVPSEVGKLRSLEILSLSTNNFTGEIPVSIGNCSNLTALELGANFFTGSIPDVFDNTPRLQLLDVGNPIPLIEETPNIPIGNSLSGSFPSSLGNCSFLLYLDVSGNPNLGGGVPPQISLLTQLQFLDMSICSFNGVLEDWWGNMTNLRHIHIQKNFLEGNIPASLGKLTKLIELALSMNSLSGAVPETITNCTSLELLSLSHNSLTGKLGDLSVGKWSRTLNYLHLAANFFTGVIPLSMANYSALENLSLGLNALDPQSMPEWIGSFPSLQKLDFGSMHLQGEIPEEIGRLQNLQYFEVGSNSLSGAIPSALANCTLLTYFGAYENYFSGTLPPELGQLSNLEYFSICYNSLTGSIPLPFVNLTSMSVFEVNANSLSGRIDSIDWGMMSHLEYYNLSENYFIGPIPSSLGNFSGLCYLDLSANHLTGHIPASLGNLTQLASLNIDLSFNKLSGKIPESVSKSSQLVALSLRNNDLQGTIPSEVGESINLETLDLSRNRLEGKLPESLRNCSKLWELHLQKNQLSGGLHTDFFREVVHLRHLDLSDNLFSGSWPSQLESLQDIQFINLSVNNFSGSIMVPKSEPSVSAAWSLLESLDISFNNFSGAIPTSLGALPVLKFLNVSYNNFHGPLPNSNSFQGNFSNTSFLGNPALCGTVLGPERECPSQSASRAHRSCKAFVCRRVWIAMTAAISGILLLAATLTMLRWWKGRRSSSQRKIQNVTLNQGVPFYRISEGEIRSMMTLDHVISRGASSVVYKGSCPGGQTFAIKSLDHGTCTPPRRHEQEQLLQEVRTLARLRHRNVLKVLSFYSGSGVEAIILEYMPKGCLHKQLYPSEGEPCQLPFQVRLGIATGIAEGMKYLHHDLPSSVIHGDLKPTNILLDQDFIAKVADFGLSKLVQEEQAGGKPQGASVSTIHVYGTPGYIPPEYAFEGKVSTRGDVYSYGVVLLEILTGRPPIEKSGDKSLMLHAPEEAPDGARAGGIVGTTEPSCSGGYRSRILSLYEAKSLDMLDEELLQESTLSSTKREQMKLLLLVALSCTRDMPQGRPTMSDVCKILVQINEMGQDSPVAWRTIGELVNQDPPQEDA